MTNRNCRIFAPGNYSEIRHRVRIGSFHVFEFQTRGSLDVGDHAHSTTTLGYVLKGTAGKSYRASKFSYTVQPGHVELEPANLVHADPIGPAGLRGFVIELQNNAFGTWPELVEGLHRPQLVRDGPVCLLYRKLIDELNLGDDASRLSAEGLILEMLGAFVRRPRDRRKNDSPPWSPRAIEYLRTNYSKSVHLGDLARETGLHPAHLARAFRRHFGMTVGAYIRHLRIERCKQLLSGTSVPLAEIASQLGFCDQSHLGHAFRRSLGCTPLEYRRIQRRNRN
jgi:AraC family transcriptional regulator